MNLDADICIAGAGPVAMVVAMRLCLAGFKVNIFEVLPELSQEPRAVVYSGPCLIELKRLGILPELRKKGWCGCHKNGLAQAWW